ncbi:unnamed protein product, partial [Sphacelaria rigidula]
MSIRQPLIMVERRGRSASVGSRRQQRRLRRPGAGSTSPTRGACQARGRSVTRRSSTVLHSGHAVEVTAPPSTPACPMVGGVILSSFQHQPSESSSPPGACQAAQEGVSYTPPSAGQEQQPWEPRPEFPPVQQQRQQQQHTGPVSEQGAGSSPGSRPLFQGNRHQTCRRWTAESYSAAAGGQWRREQQQQQQQHTGSVSDQRAQLLPEPRQRFGMGIHQPTGRRTAQPYLAAARGRRRLRREQQRHQQ